MEKLTFDRAVSEIKALVGKTWKIVIVPYILMAIYSIVTVNFTDIYKGFDNPNVVGAMGMETMLSKLGFMYLNVGVTLLMTGFIAVFVINTFQNANESKLLEPMGLLIQSLKCLPRLIGGFLIIVLFFAVSIIVLTILSVLAMMWLIPIGIILIITEILFMLFLYYFFSMSAYILILEKGSFILRRCFDIFKKSKGLLAIFFGITIGVSLIMTMFSMPAQMINIAGVKLVLNIVSSSIGVVVGPLLTAFGFVMYNEIIRKEQDDNVEIEALETDFVVDNI